MVYQRTSFLYRYRLQTLGNDKVDRLKTLGECIKYHFYIEVSEASNNNIPERWVSMKDVCTHLDTNRFTVTKWIETKNMPAVKMAGYGNTKSVRLMNGFVRAVPANKLMIITRGGGGPWQYPRFTHITKGGCCQAMRRAGAAFARVRFLRHRDLSVPRS